MSKGTAKYTCAKTGCKFKTNSSLEVYRIQARALRGDSNKTTGKSRRSATFCEKHVRQALANIELPGGDQ